MSIASNVKSQIDTQIIENLGSTLTITPITSSKDSYGEFDVTSGTSRTITAVPFGNLKTMKQLESFGELNAGELRLVVKGDETFDSSDPDNDLFTWQGNDYNLVEIHDIPLQDIILVKVLTLRKATL